MNYDEFAEKYHIELNDKQKEAVIDENTASLLLAVPGSGKTTVIVAKIGYLMLCRGINASDILTVTYSKAAAKEMRDRFKHSFPKLKSPTFSTIHSFCHTVLKYASSFGLDVPKLLTDSSKPNQASIIKKIIVELCGEYPNETTIKNVQKALSISKNRLLKRKEISCIKCIDLNILGVDFLTFYDTYQKALEDANCMDFDDMLVLAYEQLSSSLSTLTHFQNLYPYINVDEAQDTSYVQHEILQLLGITSNIFMVGDDDQSIYGFRGADPTMLLEFENRYINGQMFFMENNYRCAINIAEAADFFIKKNRFRFEKHIIPKSNSAGSITITQTQTLSDQYQLILKRIQDAIGSNKTLGILYRHNESGAPLISELSGAGIQVKSRDSFSFFFEHITIQRIHDILTYANNPYDKNIFLNNYYKLGLFISKSESIRAVELHEKHPDWTLLKCVAELEELKEFKRTKIVREDIAMHGIKTLQPEQAIRYIVQRYENESGFEPIVQKTPHRAYRVEILCMLAKKYKTISDFLNAIDEMKKSKQNNLHLSSNITLSTIHSAKGLEFDDVIAYDISHDNYSGINDTGILYTICSRAMHRLTLISCGKPSSLIMSIPSDLYTTKSTVTL